MIDMQFRRQRCVRGGCKQFCFGAVVQECVKIPWEEEVVQREVWLREVGCVGEWRRVEMVVELEITLADVNQD
jgi:hypothetical protein